MSDSPHQMKILISGAGIAGPCLAYWLSRTKFNPSVTVVERSPVPRPTGQSIDIRGSAISIIKKMSLEEAVRSRHTTEEGTRMVYSDGRIIAEFGRGHNFTAVYEILRADLCGLFLDATKDLENVEYVYGDYVTGLEQSEKNVAVTFNSGKKETYDLVVGADGATSKIRSMVLDKETLQDSYKFIGQYVAYFSIPSRDTDTKHWYWYNEPNGIGMMTRPHRTPETIGCYMCITTPAHGVRDQEVEDALEAGPEEQRRVLHKRFANSGWETKRILEGMDHAGDFYMSRAAQVKLPRWHQGRAALLGDAAHATFGIGTSLAIEGAYMLAGEITKIASNDEVPLALDKFEEKFRARYIKSEDLPPFFPQFGFPQTAWGLRLRDTALWIASKTKIYKLLPGDDEGKVEPVAEYDWN